MFQSPNKTPTKNSNHLDNKTLNPIQDIELELDSRFLDNEHLNTFLSLSFSNPVRLKILHHEYENFENLLNPFISKIIEKILLNLVYDTITIQYKESLREAMLILSNDKDFSSQLKNYFTYDENFINFSIFIDSKYSPSNLIDATIILILNIKLHKKYCKITVDVISLEIIYKFKEKFGMKLLNCANIINSKKEEIIIDKKNSKTLIKEINLTKILNNQNKIRFYIEYPVKEIDNLRICFNNLIYNKNKLLPRKFPKLISREAYIYMMATKNPLNFGCQYCMNENNEKILQVKFREFEQHNCRIHLCKTCVDMLCKNDCMTDCLSCEEFVMNFYNLDKLYHYNQINQKMYEG